MPGWQGLAVARRQAADGHCSWPCRHRRPRGIADARSQPGLTRAERGNLPVLAIGGAEGLGAAVAETMQLAATNVQTLVIPSCGHFVPEEAPDELLAALIPFLTA